MVTGPTPDGPFADPLGKPLIPIGMVPTYSRDPTVLVDDDGSAYLCFGTFNYYIAKLNPDLISLAEQPRPVKIIGEQHRDDKPFLHKRGGLYYLSWGCWYAVGTSPYGPFNYSGGVINTTALANTSFASGGGTKDRHGSFFTFHGQTYFACNDESHGGGGGFRSTIIAYAHYRANGTIAPIRIDETGVGNYNNSAALAAGLPTWTIEAEDFYAVAGGAVKRQRDPSGPDPNAFEMANLSAGSSISFPRVHSGNTKMQLTVLYSNGGSAAGEMVFWLKGQSKPYALCKLAPTGSWDTYANVSCGGASRFGADVATGMMPDVNFTFTGPATEFARVDAFYWELFT